MDSEWADPHFQKKNIEKGIYFLIEFLNSRLDLMPIFSEIFNEIGSSYHLASKVMNITMRILLYWTIDQVPKNSCLKRSLNLRIFFAEIAEIVKKLISDNGDIDIDEFNKKFDSQYENWHSNHITKTKAFER